MIRNLHEKTGKTLEEWVGIANQTGLTKNREIIDFLKREHGLTYGYANLIAISARDAATGAPTEGDDLVAAQYAGAKAGLLPLYQTLVQQIQQFGPDVELAPKKTYVSLRRKKQFGIIQPTTASRVDLGINLKDQAPTGRLEAAGSFNSMVSHRVRLSAPDDVDQELIAWLRQAYDAA
jgi:hypothetical protein